MLLIKFVAPTAVILMLSLGSVAFAAPNPLLPHKIAQNTVGQQGHGDQHWDRFLQQLNLTPDQAQKVQAIRDQYNLDLAQRRQALKQAKQELQDLMVSTASEDQVREKHSQVETLEQQLRSVGFEQMLAIRQVLTPEQRTQAAEIIQKRQEDFRNRFSKQQQQ